MAKSWSHTKTIKRSYYLDGRMFTVLCEPDNVIPNKRGRLLDWVCILISRELLMKTCLRCILRSEIENPLKMVKNAFYLTSKALSILKIFKFLSWLFGHISKQLHEKDNVNFKLYDVTIWWTNNCNTHFDQYLKK